jgi:hypothetical protein
MWLRNQIEDKVPMYKRLLNREMLRDPEDGANYFKRFLRPHFIKGVQTVFLYRFMQFMKHNRDTVDLQRRMTRFQLTGDRFIESWMGVLPDLDITSQEAIDHVVQRVFNVIWLMNIAAATPGADPHINVPWTDEMAMNTCNQLHAGRRLRQRRAFPVSDNLLALILASLAGSADLTQDQRSTLTSIMTHRGRTLDQYNVTELTDLFLEMFCSTRTAVDNPMVQPSGIGHRRSFFVLDEGNMDGTDGYWAEDDEDGAEGVRIPVALADVVWVFDDAGFTWYQRRFQGRQTRSGKGRGRVKEKEKAEEKEDSSDQGKEKSRGKGRRKDRSHMVS